MTSEGSTIPGSVATTDILQLSVFFALALFVLIAIVPLALMLWRHRRGRAWKEMLPQPVRFFASRLGISIAFGVAIFAVVAAGLVLNSHRPPADSNPILKLKGAGGPTRVLLQMDECGDDVTGKIKVKRRGNGPATIYSDQDGLQTVPLDRKGRGTFFLTGPTAKRGLLSCYLQLPVVRGGGAVSVELSAGSEIEVDTVASVPAPTGFLNGRWLWRCPEGDVCPAMATAGLAFEDAARQVTVLVLAALLGSMIAIFVNEAMIEPVRRRLDQHEPDA